MIIILLYSLVLGSCNLSASEHMPALPGSGKEGSLSTTDSALNPTAEDLLSIVRTTTTPTAGATQKPRQTSLPSPSPQVVLSPIIAASRTESPTRTETSLPGFHLCSPLTGYERDKLSKIVSDDYDPPPPGSDDRHQGVDFVYHRQAGQEGSILGVGVQSVLFGTVAAAISDSFPYGNFVIVESPYWHLPQALVDEFEIGSKESLYLLYAHMQDGLLVELGQRITSCQVLGKVGASGNTEAPHLHLETRIGPAGAVFPVMSAFTDDPTAEERANYVLWRKSMLFRHFDPMRLMDYGLSP